MKRLQQVLQLRDEDIAVIEARVIPPPTPKRERGGEQETDRDVDIEVTTNITPETATNEDDLSSEKGVDYTKLRDLLAAENWKDADYETYLGNASSSRAQGK